MKEANIVGLWGEQQAAAYLRKKRWKLLACNYRCRLGEIDLIAQNRRYLIFVEVKTRKTERFGTAAEYVNHYKRTRLIATAKLYLAQNPTHLQPRFDVIEIYAPDGVSTRRPRIVHIENAFFPDEGET